jgi:prepilin-type N-terminal cleavage/methylation domain-containing protein
MKMHVKMPARPGLRPGGRAFTLIELMIVIAIMAVVMSLSIPTFYRSLEKDTIRKATRDILDVCADARAQAIISGRPCDLVIRPGERMLLPQLAPAEGQSGEEMLLAELERRFSEASGEEGGGKVPGMLPEDIAIMFIGVNFMPDLQNFEEVRVRFYPNGTGDEFTLLIRSDRNEWRKFTMDVATAVINWEVVK